MFSIYLIVGVFIGYTVYRQLVDHEDLLSVMDSRDEFQDLLKNQKEKVAILAGLFWPVLLVAYLIKSFN